VNLARIIGEHARYRAEKPAIEAQDVSLAYRDLDVLARRIATRLKGAGVGVGDLVGAHLRDTPHHLATLVAIMHVGGIILPLDWRAAAAERGRVIARFPPRAVVSEEGRGLPEGTRIVTLDDIAATEPDAAPPASLPDQHPMVYSLTSGTTGQPKSIVLTHDEMFGRTVTLAFEGVIAGNDRMLAQMPLAYSVGRVVAACALNLGATIVMFPSLFEPADLAAFARERRVTALILSPNVGKQLAALGSADRHLLPDLRILVFSGAKLQPEDRALIAEKVAPRVIDFYGSTGGGPTTMIANAEDGVSPTSVGRPMAATETEVVDEDHNPVADGATGRIRIRGIGVCRRFAGAVEPGDEGFRDGWYYPGDLGSFDEAGRLHIVGRVSDFIKRGGIMVYAQEVEQALMRHPEVADAAVVGAPSPELGEEVVAFVVLRSPVESRALIAHCRKELAPAKVPARTIAIDVLPRNPNGKVVKNELRAKL
jgi:long-chain acyl-CoA synthetase